MKADEERAGPSGQGSKAAWKNLEESNVRGSDTRDETSENETEKRVSSIDKSYSSTSASKEEEEDSDESSEIKSEDEKYLLESSEKNKKGRRRRKRQEETETSSICYTCDTSSRDNLSSIDNTSKDVDSIKTDDDGDDDELTESLKTDERLSESSEQSPVHSADEEYKLTSPESQTIEEFLSESPELLRVTLKLMCQDGSSTAKISQCILHHYPDFQGVESFSKNLKIYFSSKDGGSVA